MVNKDTDIENEKIYNFKALVTLILILDQAFGIPSITSHIDKVT